MSENARAALPKETIDALEALERLYNRYHTVTAEEALAAQRQLLAGTDIAPSLGFEFLKVEAPPEPEAPAPEAPAPEAAPPTETPPS